MKAELFIIVLLLSAAVCCIESPKPAEEKNLSPELNVYIWEDYIDPAVVADFELEYGVKVNIETYEDDEVMVSVVMANPDKYDLVFPSEPAAPSMLRRRLLAPLDMENIPNIRNIEPRFQNLHQKANKTYMVIYDWGTTGVVVNRRYVNDTSNSWGILWDPRYVGRIAMSLNQGEVIGSTLVYLGYSHFSLDGLQLEQARIKLLEQKPLLAGYLDDVTTREKLVSGELWAAQIYNGDAERAVAENPDLDYFIPKEGSSMYFDLMAVPSEAKHKYTAEVFINYILRPDVHARITEYSGYANPNRESRLRGFISNESLSNLAIYSPEDVFGRLEPYVDLWNVSAYNRIWAELQGAG